MMKFIFLALAATGEGISGSDRIFIEFAKRWGKTSKITIYVWQEGYRMCQRQNLDNLNIKYKQSLRSIDFQISNMEPWNKFGFIVNYFARILEGIKIGLTLKVEDSPENVIYSASEFWMDSLPAWLLKLRHPRVKWVAAWYQTAPNPFTGYSWGLLYWLVQIPIKPLVKRWADLILVNNEEERQIFPKQNSAGKVIVVLGAVDVTGIKKWRERSGSQSKIYDAVFQGRFHPQKGVTELIDIWKAVVMEKSNAKLVMIGDGPLMEDIRIKIQKSKLENNIILTGYLFDGEEKYRIFSQSQMVLHPALFDSGGMAAAEAMAFGLPAIGFDLKSFKSYYPKGMVKIKIGDIKSFAISIIELLNNMKKRIRLGKEAQNWIEQNMSWDNRAEEVILKINSL